MDQQYTVILVPEGQSAVRRYSVSAGLLKRCAFAAAAVLVLALILAADWVRLRLQSVDVSKLQAEAALQRDEIVALSKDVARTDQELERLGDFERKVRIIADIPSTVAERPVKNGTAQGGPENDVDLRSDHGEPPPAEAQSAEAPEALGEPAAKKEPLTFDLGTGGANAHVVLPTLRNTASDLLTIALTRVASFEELVEGLESKSAQLASTPSIWPTKGWVTSGYGRRTSPFTGRQHFHAGIDVAAAFGTPVLAPAKGRVVFAGRKGALGKAVIVDHGHRIRTWYGHMQEIHVKQGQELERGDSIGAVGSTGRSTGPHLHYVVEVKGKSVNPINYLIN